MLCELRDRGPDSAGLAVYGAEATGVTKICAVAPEGAVAWQKIARQLAKAVGASVTVDEIEDHAIFKTKGDGGAARKMADRQRARGNGAEPGAGIEIFKGVGDPNRIAKRLELAARKGSRAIGHTRMAT